jgi:hypothetical protein
MCRDQGDSAEAENDRQEDNCQDRPNQGEESVWRGAPEAAGAHDARSGQIRNLGHW